MNPDASRLSLLRVVMAVFAAGLLLATWRLWTPGGVLSTGPQIPWLTAFLAFPPAVEGAALAVLAAGLIGMNLAPRRPLATRLTTGAMTLALAVVCGFDQHRLQPWAWQFLLMGTLLTLAPGRMGLTCCRWIVVSVYLHSALSKLDAAFLHAQGQLLLSATLAPLGIDSQFWPEDTKTALAAAFPLGELLIGGLLLWPRTRSWGLAGSLAMHGGLLWTLGVGLRHEWGVLLWNLYWIAQNLLLFWPQPLVSADMRPPAHHLPDRAAKLFTALVVAFPLLENWGRCDHWPAWAVYSSRPAQVQILIDAGEAASLPIELSRFLRSPAPLEDRVPLSLEAWSFETRNCPVYPQLRYRLALTAALLSPHVSESAVTVEVGSTPDRWTGRRQRRTISGLDAVRREAEKSFWNVAPRQP